MKVCPQMRPVAVAPLSAMRVPWTCGSEAGFSPLPLLKDLAIDQEAKPEALQRVEDQTFTSVQKAEPEDIIPKERQLRDEEDVSDDTWVIPSAGPDYGKLDDQATILKGRSFPTVMVLPLAFPATRGFTPARPRCCSCAAPRR